MLENYQDILEIKDICAVLRIGRKTAYKLLQSGQIPYRKVGRNYKIRKEELWISIKYRNQCGKRGIYRHC